MALPSEIIQDIYKHQFHLAQRQLHKDIKDHVQDAHERLEKHTTWLFNHGREGWKGFNDLLREEFVNWGLWHLCTGTAANTSAKYVDLGTGVILKNSCYVVGKYLLKSEACVMEAYPRIVIRAKNDNEKMIRRKRLGFEQFKPVCAHP